MSENKIGDIFIEKGGTARAFLRPHDGSPDTLLAAMNLYVHESHPSIRELFVNLAAAVADRVLHAVSYPLKRWQGRQHQHVFIARANEVRE
jgi:hypothetical protein